MTACVSIFLKSLRDYFRDGGIVYSASLAYFAMVAIVPFCLFLTAVFGYVLGEDQTFYNYLIEKLVGLFPKTAEGVAKELGKLITYRGLGKISLILYGILSFQLFTAMQSAMNAIFKIKKERSLIGTALLSLVVITLISLILTASFTLTTFLPLLHKIKGYVPWLKVGALTAFLLRYVIPFLLVFAVSVIVYVILPKKHIRLHHAAAGSLFTAFMLETSKHLYTWYVSSVINMGAIYGSLSAFVMFLIWVFYASAIFLIGGEIVHNLGERTIASRRA